jgi:hypothetical protein
MREVEWENKKDILMDLVNKLENDLMDYLHYIEEDETISDESFKRLDKLSNQPFATLTNLRAEIYYI